MKVYILSFQWSKVDRASDFLRLIKRETLWGMPVPKAHFSGHIFLIDFTFNCFQSWSSRTRNNLHFNTPAMYSSTVQGQLWSCAKNPLGNEFWCTWQKQGVLSNWWKILVSISGNFPLSLNAYKKYILILFLDILVSLLIWGSTTFIHRLPFKSFSRWSV